MNFLTDKEVIVLLGPTTSSTADSTSAVVDMVDAQGVAFVVGIGDSTSAVSVAVITGSTNTATGSTAATISISTGDHSAIFDLHKPTVRYAKAVLSPGAGAVDGGHVYAIKYGLRKQPVTQGSTSIAGSTVKAGSS